MKSSLSVLLILVLISSCKSVDYLIERGDEDVVFENAINNIESDPELSIRDIQKFEKEYEKVMNNDKKNLLSLLNQNNSSKNLESLFIVTKKIKERQNRLAALVALQDKSNDFISQIQKNDVRSAVIKSVEILTSEYLKEATFFIEEAKNTGSRDAAKYAYKYLEKIKAINPNLSILSKYLKEAVQLGSKTVLIAFDEPSIDQLGEENVVRIINQLKLEESTWTKFEYEIKDKKDFDQVIQVSITDISIGQNHTVEESIVTSSSINKVSFGDAYGTTSTKTQVAPVFSNEIRKLKEANLKGSITLYDIAKNEVLLTKDLLLFFEFNNSSFAQNQSRSILNINDFRTRFRVQNNSGSIAGHSTPNVVKGATMRMTSYDKTKSFPEYNDVVEMFSQDLMERLENFVRKSVLI